LFSSSASPSSSSSASSSAMLPAAAAGFAAASSLPSPSSTSRLLQSSDLSALGLALQRQQIIEHFMGQTRSTLAPAATAAVTISSANHTAIPSPAVTTSNVNATAASTSSASPRQPANPPGLFVQSSSPSFSDTLGLGLSLTAPNNNPQKK